MALSHHLIMLCVCILTMASATAATVNARSNAVPNALCTLQALDYEPEDLQSESRLAALFNAWNHKHGKEYSEEEPGTASPEKERRFQIFKENLHYIHEHNSKGQSSFTLGLTRFADLTNDEFKASNFFGAGHSGEPIKNRSSESRFGRMLSSCDVSGLPASLDWREKGVVVGVKNQGRCESCWAFSAVGAIESAHAIATGSLVSLSEQQLVSCDTINFGCIGGWMDWAFKWVVDNGGISSEADYPYTSGNSGIAPMCHIDQLDNIAASIVGYVLLETFDELALQCAVGTQPVSAALHASGLDFQLYTGGVFDITNCPTNVDHAVLVVGWGVSNGVEYWIAKNSWGAWWGCEGYIYLAKGKHLPQGICGLHTRSSFPVATQASTKCSEGLFCFAKQTCCCISQVGSACETWGCCPEGFPICSAGACYSQGASSLEVLLHAPAKNQKPTLPYKDPQFSGYKHASQ